MLLPRMLRRRDSNASAELVLTSSGLGSETTAFFFDDLMEWRADAREKWRGKRRHLTVGKTMPSKAGR